MRLFEFALAFGFIWAYLYTCMLYKIRMTEDWLGLQSTCANITKLLLGEDTEEPAG